LKFAGRFVGSTQRSPRKKGREKKGQLAYWAVMKLTRAERISSKKEEGLQPP